MRTFLGIILMSLMLMACNQSSALTESTIKISTEGSAVTTVTLNKVVEGKNAFAARADREGKELITISYTPEYEGFYSLTASGIERKDIYLKGNETLHFRVKGNKLYLDGENTIENKLLEEWLEKTADIRNRATNPRIRTSYSDFISRLDDVNAFAGKFERKLNTDSKEFNRLMKAYMSFDKDDFAISYVFIPKIASDPVIFAAYPQYYYPIVDPNKFSDPTILGLPFGMKFTQKYVTVALMMKKQDTSDKDQMIGLIKDPTVKGALIVAMSQGIKTYYEAYDTYEKYKNIFNEKQTEDFKEIINRLYKARVRTDVVDFNYPDKDGKKYSLKDFKGKVVVLDFWATWCMPCIQEIPHLLKLKEEFKDKDIVFIGISADKPKDKAKWEKFLKDNEMPGIQLFSNNTGEIMDYYKVNSFPRFMVVGKDGKMVNDNAPKPSNPYLKRIIVEELTK